MEGAFVCGSGTSAFAARAERRAEAACGRGCARPRAARSVVAVAYDMDGSGEGSLGDKRIKSSGVAGDSRCFKVTYVLPSESRLFTFRELQNVYTTKKVPFTSWYAEQQRIMKMGGKIIKVELISGGQMRSVGNI